MEQREKLIELIKAAFESQENDKCRECAVYDCAKCVSEYIADHLLANGVVVLPCRCGECEHNKENENYRFCEVNQRMLDRYGYCQHAKRKGGGE